MLVKQARSIGGRKAVAGFLWIFLLMEGLLLYVQTREGFAYGVRMFLALQSDRLSIGVVVVMFFTVFLLGRVAGKEILVDESNHIVVALTHTLFTLLVCLAFIWVVTYVSHIYIHEWWTGVALLALISGCIWMIAVRGIKRAGKGDGR